MADKENSGYIVWNF